MTVLGKMTIAMEMARWKNVLGVGGFLLSLPASSTKKKSDPYGHLSFDPEVKGDVFGMKSFAHIKFLSPGYRDVYHVLFSFGLFFSASSLIFFHLILYLCRTNKKRVPSSFRCLFSFFFVQRQNKGDTL